MTVVEFLRARLDEDEQRWMRLRDAVWPDLIAVVPSDDTGLPEDDEPMGCVTVGPQYSPKAYARVWNPAQSKQAGQLDNRDDGWVYHHSSIELLSPEVASRMLAEVDAKRRIINLCEEWVEIGEIPPHATWSDEAAGGVVARHVLSLMALPYADRSDYDPTWAPADVTDE